MSTIAALKDLRSRSGTATTIGLPDPLIASFLETDAQLRDAIRAASLERDRLEAEFGATFALDEGALVTQLQEGVLNFYRPETVNPYVPLAARGPWIVTAHGAVLHDSGGYGMLGSGHAPQAILSTMARPYVMANVMTPSFSQARVIVRLRAEVGHTRAEGCPFARFLFLNSGSESVTVASRIADANAAKRTPPGTTIKLLALEGGFHGRTDRPAQASDSSLSTYRSKLASFRGRDNLITVPPNDIIALRKAFADAARDGVFIEAMFAEPVMGEGCPGFAMSRAFYDAARELTHAHGSMLVIDSIQAGLRAQGVLSIVDYPGFEDCDPPDMETYSKALNGGQYPMSVLALSSEAADRYAMGSYGNTMTTNPRALEVATTCLEAMDDALRANIRSAGAELVAKLKSMADRLPDGAVLSVQGTGLLVAAELDPDTLPVVGFNGVEMWCRRNGLGLIHGGKNALRLTPHFKLTSAEIDLIVSTIEAGIRAHAPMPEHVRTPELVRGSTA
jgi:acetylornithine/succinyldiaminopimelate/putrescine aminotransferase